jgi:FkbM family methyltransferase
MSGCTFPNHPLFVAVTGRPPVAAWTRVKGGEVLARLDDFVGRAAFFVGDLDRKVSALFERVVRPGDVVIDVGANIGITTLRLASLVGERGKVHAFEPNADLIRQLKAMLDRNAMRQVELHPFALSDKDGQASLSVPAGNMGAASMVEGRIAAPVATMPAELRRLDAALGDLKSLRLIKIDVEGAEHKVIAGGRRTIERLRPVVIFEANVGAEREETFRYFKRIDYRLFGLKKSLFRLSLGEITDVNDARFHDIVAFPRETDVALPGGAQLRPALAKAA